jgi:hypothetical protein
MDIVYKGLEFDILNELKGNNLYIFSNPMDKIEIENTLKNSFVDYTLMTESEFLEKYILSKKNILKEEKETIFFYNSINKDLKKKMGINGYFDCIDIAYRYYNFMNEYIKYELDLSDIELFEWQEDKIKDIFSIHSSMLKKVEKEDAIPRYLLPLYSYENKKLLDKYEKVIFVNKFNFDSLEKKRYMNSDKFEFWMGVSKGDFDEENMILNNITIPLLKNKPKIVECSDKFTQLIYLIDNKDKFDIVYDNEENLDNMIKKENIYLNQNLIQTIFNYTFSITKNYLILEKIYLCLDNSIGNRFQISDLYKLYSIEGFRKIFNIPESDLEILKSESMFNMYITEERLNSVKILLDIKKYKSKEDFSSLFEKIGKYRDESDTMFSISYEFMSALNEINSLDLSFLSNFYIEYLKLFIKYLKAKKINFNLEENAIIKIKDKNKISNIKKENFNLMNLQGSIKAITGSVFNSIQRMKLGLPTLESITYSSIYSYIFNMYNSVNVCLMYIKNEEENISEMSFISDFIYKNNIKVEKIEIDLSEKSNIFSQIYMKEFNLDIDKEKYLTQDDQMPVNGTNNIEYISISDFLNLKDSELTYFMSKKINKIEVLETMIRSNVVGNIIHKVMEYIFTKDENVDINKLLSDENLLNNKIDTALMKIKEYIDFVMLTKYSNFFEYEYLSDIKVRIKQFISLLLKDLNNKKILRCEPEYKMYKNIKVNDKKIKFGGRIDLYLETSDEIYIIDFKTGKKDTSNKKRYSNQVKLYEFINETSKEIKTYLSYILDFDIFHKVESDESDLTEELIYKILETYTSLDKEFYEKGKKGQYNNYEEIIIWN